MPICPVDLGLQPGRRLSYEISICQNSRVYRRANPAPPVCAIRDECADAECPKRQPGFSRVRLDAKDEDASVFSIKTDVFAYRTYIYSY